MPGKMETYYIALIHKESGSGYGVSFPDVPGVIAVADTLDASLAEGAVALGFALEDWEGAFPAPRSLDEIRAAGGYQQGRVALHLLRLSC